MGFTQAIHLPTSCTLYAVLVPQRLFFCGAVERKSVGKPQYLTCWGCWERKKNRCAVWVGKGVQTTREFRWPGARACGPGGGNMQRIDRQASGHGMWLPRPQLTGLADGLQVPPVGHWVLI